MNEDKASDVALHKFLMIRFMLDVLHCLFVLIYVESFNFLIIIKFFLWKACFVFKWKTILFELRVKY